MLCLTAAFQLLLVLVLVLVLVLCSQGIERCPSAFCECSDWEEYKITCRDIYFIPSLPEDTQTLSYADGSQLGKEMLHKINESLLICCLLLC